MLHLVHQPQRVLPQHCPHSRTPAQTVVKHCERLTTLVNQRAVRSHTRFAVVRASRKKGSGKEKADGIDGAFAP